MIQGKREWRGRTRLVLALIAAACALAAIAAAAIAEDAAETTTFGKDGIASESLGLHYEETGFSSVAARPDGGLVAEREGQLDSYLANGTPDPAVPPQAVPKYRQVIPLAGGKSLVLESSRLTRVNSDGSVDTGFGGGTVKTPWIAKAVAELASGRILVVSTAVFSKQTTTPIFVELVSPDGSVEKVTGEHGGPLLTVPGQSYEGTGEFAIAPTDDGGALVSGDGFLLQLRADGSPNPAFGGDGVVDGLPPLVSGRVLADGSVAAVGWDRSVDKKDLAVLRFTLAGAPDTGFGGDGIRRFDFGGEEEARVALWAADGSVIVGGSTRTPSTCVEAMNCEEVPMLVAFDPEGGLEPGFGSDGALKLQALAGPSDPGSGKGVEALVRRPDGSIVAAGSSPPKRTTAFLAAVSTRGALLPDFGEGGIVRARKPVPATRELTGIAPLGDGKLLAGGITDAGIEDAAVLIRYAADGGLDRSFGAGAGYVTVDEARFANGFATDSGKVLMSTHDIPRSRLFELRAADGAREQSFGSEGLVLLPRRVSVEKLAFAADGGVIVAGTRDVAGLGEPGVVLRYRSNGKPDRGFGQNGRVELRTPAGREVRARALIAGRDGRILVGGVSESRFTLTELLPDGRPNPRFGSRGWVVKNGGRALASFRGTARSVALRRAGSRIYLAGVVRNSGRIRVVLMRLNAAGRLDRSFGRDGRRVAPVAEAGWPQAILPSRHGVLVVLGEGSRPLLFFGRDGKVRRQQLAPRQQFVDNVRATISRGQLVLGWNAYSRPFPRPVNYLATRPLDGR